MRHYSSQINSTTMIMPLLKEKTKQAHENVEANAYSPNIMDGSLNKQQYTELIIANYIFNTGVETTAYYALRRSGYDAAFALNDRIKTPALMADLQALGIDPITIETKLPAINTVEDALGYLYVAEGSTLGGAVIGRALAKNENLKDLTEFNFYGCYGELTGERWKNFIIASEQAAGRQNNDNAIVTAAIKGFEYFGQCLAVAKEFSKVVL